MAQPQEPRTGEKRGPGRPRSTATPAMKKQRLSAATTPLQNSPIAHSPAAASPAPILEKKVVRLPAKVAENKPLPTLSEPQSHALSNDEYQSIAASAVLTTSLDRSRLNWISNGIFKRHWVKPESGKNAKPPPPGNPDAKLMKSRGPCRMRIEPHIFEAEVYIEERPKPPPGPKQYAGPTHTPFGAPYRPTQPGQPPQNPHIQNRTQSPAVVTPAHPPLQPPLRGGSNPSTPTPAPPAEKKADPVISMLASRASSDPELKSLMKEVATGNATPDQLKTFQRHIDELTAIIQTQKKADGPSTPNAESGSNAIQYDGAAVSRPTPQQPVPQPTQQRPSYPAAQVPAYHQQPAWSPPVPIPTNLPVVFSFSTPGASEDRFLFPEHCILEALSPQHLLVSFMVVRKGRDAIDTSGLDPDKEYWQPITMMVEVAYGREEILNCIRRWVKPAEDSRKHMEEVMQRCERAPETHLALRLPVKSTLLPESEEASKEATPVVDDKTKSKPTVKVAKKAASKTAAPPGKPAEPATRNPASTGEPGNEPVPDAAASASDQKDAPAASTDATQANEDTTMAEDDGRPKRATRKSVRISEV